MHYPYLYLGGPRDYLYNSRLFKGMLLETCWQALCLFFIPYGAYYTGNPVGLYEFGTVMTAATVRMAHASE